MLTNKTVAVNTLLPTGEPGEMKHRGTIFTVGPLVGLVVSFGFGWLQRLCGLTITWIVWPLTGRPLQQLGAACQSVWSGDMGRYTGLLVYVYALLLLLWWLTPHSASAKVGLLSLTAMPCFTASVYSALHGFVQTASRTLHKTLIHPFTGGRLRGAKNGFRRSRTVSNCSGDTNAVEYKSMTEVPPPAKFYVLGEGDDDENDGQICDGGRSVIRQSCVFPFVAAWAVVKGVFSTIIFIMRGICALPSRTPRLEARGRVESSIYHNVEERYCQTLRRNNSKAALMTKLPWKSFSRLWGFVHNLYLPFYLRVLGLNIYSRMFHVNLNEAEDPKISNYRNLSDFFRRRLKPGLRPIDDEHVLTSPADGKVLYLSRVRDGMLEQVKGVTYSIRGFLGPPDGINVNSESCTGDKLQDDVSDTDYVSKLVTRVGNELWQCIIYLAPGDYHHFHSPTDWTVNMRRHIPGELFSVNPGIARWLQGLFSFNERAVYTGTWQHGFFSFTAVGATNVGSIAVDFDRDLATNTSTPYIKGSYKDYRFDTTNPVHVTKGQHIGEFHLGSTIVLLFEAPKDFEFAVEPHAKLRYGQALGNLPNKPNSDKQS